MARVIIGRYSVARNADLKMSQAHFKPRPFDVHFQSDRNRVYYAPSATPKAYHIPSARTGLVNTTWSTGAVDFRGGLNYAESYKNVVSQYAKAGGSFGEAVADTASKALAIAEATAAGAAAGAALGPIGAGAGAVIMGIYSTFDNFGDDIKNFFNPPDFNEGDYDRMKKNCLRSGGIPNWGHAPDNEDGCIYPDGTTSGGDYPRHPPPGVRSIRGDSFYDYDSVAGLCMGPDGKYVAIPAGYSCAPGLGPIPPAPEVPKAAPALLMTPDAAQKLLMARQRGAQKRAQLLSQLKPGETLPVGAERAYLSASDQALLNAQLPLVVPKTTMSTSSPAMKVLTTVAAAMAGDQKAAVDVRNTVDAARAGDANAITTARIMTHAQRQIMIASFVKLYTGQTIGTAGTRVAGPYGCGGGCGCHGCRGY